MNSETTLIPDLPKVQKFLTWCSKSVSKGLGPSSFSKAPTCLVDFFHRPHTEFLTKKSGEIRRFEKYSTVFERSLKDNASRKVKLLNNHR